MGSSKFINQEITIYYLVRVDHKRMAVCLTISDLKSAVYPVQRMGLIVTLWNGSEEDGDVRSECKENDGTDWYRWIECDTLCALCIGN